MYLQIKTFLFLSFSSCRLRWPTNVCDLLLAGRRRRRRRSATESATAVIRSSLDKHLGRRGCVNDDRIVKTFVVVDGYCCGIDQSQDHATVGECPARSCVHVGRFCVGRRGRQDVHLFRVRRRTNF